VSDWTKKYLGLAEHVSSWSKDPSTKVGAVIVAPDNSVVSVGYNGFPRGVEDSNERLNNREIKYKMVVHAEVNAILFARRDISGCTLYTFPLMPCSTCAGLVIQSGIKTVVAPYFDNERWVDSLKLTRAMFDEAGVNLIEIGAPDWIKARKGPLETGERYSSKEEYDEWLKKWNETFNDGNYNPVG
jgi:dCMP deaminase